MQGLYDGDFAGYRLALDAELDTALREAVVAIDANVLLDLYRFRPRTSQDLTKTLRSLGDRLVVPHQALHEFWRRRQRVQDSPGAATKAAIDALDRPGRSIRDALDRWARAVGADDDELSSLTARVDGFIDELKRELEDVSQDPSVEQHGDPILEQLEEILAGRVTPALAPAVWDDCMAEANRRIAAQKPPGYMDSDKQEGKLPEGGAGDYLVWYEVTRYAQEQDRDLLIVTRDQKEDWWWRQNSDFLGPHPELTLEYHQLTGHRLFLMRPADLLARASVLDVEVDQASSADAGRVALIESEASAGRIGTVLAVDIADFGRADRDEEIRLQLQTSLYEILREALANSGLPGERCHYEDRGDGVVVIFPPAPASLPIIKSFPDQLLRVVRHYNRSRPDVARLQLRVAVNVGMIFSDERGFYGDSLNFLFRMLDARPLRQALSESGTEVAFMISDRVYKLMLPLLSPTERSLFRSVSFRVRPNWVKAWIALPEAPSP